MKKKCLKIFSMALLVVILCTLTGCSDKDVSTNPVEESQNTSSTELLSNSVSNLASSEKNDDGIKILSVVQLQDVDTEISLVQLSEKTVSVINERGEVIKTIDEENSDKLLYQSYAYKNGVIYKDIDKNEKTQIKDKDIKEVIDLDTSKVIVEASDKVTIEGVTTSGYILTINTVENLSGTTYESKVIDKTGNTLWSKEYKYQPSLFRAVGKDFILYSDSSSENISFVDVNTGKTTELEFDNGGLKCERYGDLLFAGVDENSYAINLNTGEVISIDLNRVQKILNDKYVYATPLWGTEGIYTMQGELVKDLSEGGVKEINYKDNIYSIFSQTDFYYTLNDNFEYIVQPTKVHEDYGYLTFRPYGIEFINNNYLYYIKDSDFKADEPLNDLAIKLNYYSFHNYYKDNVSTIFQEIQDFTTKTSEFSLLDVKTLEKIEIKK